MSETTDFAVSSLDYTETSHADERQVIPLAPMPFVTSNRSVPRHLPSPTSLSNMDSNDPVRNDGDRPARLAFINLNPDRTSTPTARIPPDDALVSLYQQLSNKVLHGLFPTVWTLNGRFTAAYKHLQSVQKLHKDRTIPNKPGLQWCLLFDKVFQCHPVHIPIGWTRVVLSMARSSNVSPTYGRTGMIQRATVAADAWVRLQPNDTALVVVHTRTRVSSCEDLSTKEAYIQEIRRLLSAADRRIGTRVELLSIGIDGFSTNTRSLAWLHSEYPNVDIRLVYVVPERFPEQQEGFPTLSNRIRYGQFAIADIAAVVGGLSPNALDSTGRLVALLNTINGGKSGQLGGTRYKDWTGDRGGFRVDPDTQLESGVDPNLSVLSRQLR